MFSKSNPLKSCSKWHLVLIVWTLLATVYVVYGEYNRLTNYVAARAYSSGIHDAVVRIVDESAKCQPLPINVDDKKATLISVDCLKAPEATTN